MSPSTTHTHTQSFAQRIIHRMLEEKFRITVNSMLRGIEKCIRFGKVSFGGETRRREKMLYRWFVGNCQIGILRSHLYMCDASAHYPNIIPFCGYTRRIVA